MTVFINWREEHTDITAVYVKLEGQPILDACSRIIIRLTCMIGMLEELRDWVRFACVTVGSELIAAQISVILITSKPMIPNYDV